MVLGRRWSIWVVKHVGLLILRRTKCRDETPCFRHVGGPFEGTRLTPLLMDHAFSFLRLSFAVMDDFGEVVVDFGCSMCGSVYVPLRQVQT